MTKVLLSVLDQQGKNGRYNGLEMGGGMGWGSLSEGINEILL